MQALHCYLEVDEHRHVLEVYVEVGAVEGCGHEKPKSRKAFVYLAIETQVFLLAGLAQSLVVRID